LIARDEDARRGVPVRDTLARLAPRYRSLALNTDKLRGLQAWRKTPKAKRDADRLGVPLRLVN
jgi:hypothetical protein